MGLCDEEDEADIFNYLYTFVLLFFEHQNQKQGQTDFPMRLQTLSCEMDNKEYLAKQIDHLRNTPQPTQRTEEWYTFRYGLYRLCINEMHGFQTNATQYQNLQIRHQKIHRATLFFRNRTFIMKLSEFCLYNFCYNFFVSLQQSIFRPLKR